MAVVLFHVAPGQFPGGFIGVDVFFVVSGFLVGGHLYRSAHGGGIRFREFFARRARRIVPVSALVAIFTIVCCAFTVSPLNLMLWGQAATTPTVSRDGIASVLGVSNLWFGVSDQGYLMDGYQSPYTQYWSLGVEEQFYVAAPLLLAFLFCRSRNRRVAVLVIALLCVASFDLALYGASMGGVGPFFNPLTRAWELGAGLLVAALAHRMPQRLNTGALGLCAAVCGWAALVASVFTFGAHNAAPSFLTLVPVLGSSLLIALGTHRVPGAIAHLRPIQWIGDRSYSIYLWHWPLVILALSSPALAETSAGGRRRHTDVASVDGVVSLGRDATPSASRTPALQCEQDANDNRCDDSRSYRRSRYRRRACEHQPVVYRAPGAPVPGSSGGYWWSRVFDHRSPEHSPLARRCAYGFAARILRRVQHHVSGGRHPAQRHACTETVAP